MNIGHLVVLGLSWLVSSAFAGDISGTWELRFKAEWTSIPNLVCALSQKGEALTGTCHAADEPQGQKVDLTGKVDGDKVSGQWKVVTPDGDTWTYALSGTVDAKGTMIDGAFKLTSRFGNGEGSFTATKRASSRP